ncbi:signal transduction histidine kinase/CheY-like chemotaxis protein [Flavobacterium arsenatis]|uniref:histidine kinase n=1 Tax=Flavobacterium arsenatis TaxID=1484332 RepID=A0ABU1TS14_9FLAO|nr:ATP-binding protein [Flavobacterium arsenatis]MDR6968664.1 signal transduction histidine kinase/CheY-like chemotaxis protein [Flavobacterium arsenatis]
MDNKKSYIPIKVFVSYLALATLVVVAGWILYTENRVFSSTENKLASENNKILKVSNLLSNMYKTESFSRITIQSNSDVDFRNYLMQTDSLKAEIDSLKNLVQNDYQITLLDSVKLLLSKKTANIQQLSIIKNQSTDDDAVQKAINKISYMEGTLRKLNLNDFFNDPSSLKDYEKKVYSDFVDYMNENIPSDNTNTLSQKVLDSMLIASKAALSDVVRKTSKKQESLNIQENELLQNELSISEQLRKILSVIEREIIINTTKSNAEKEAALNKTNKVVTIAAGVGFVLTIFFSILILSDFSKTQSYKNQLEIANSKTETLLKNREQLISTVSHDLKTPLSTIVGYAELLGNSDLNNKQSYYTKNIKGSSEYISQLVQDLLDFTQIEAGKITIEHIPFSLKEIAIEVGKSIQSVYEQKNLELILDIDKKFNQRIVGDPFRLRQVLTNLIGNAFKFTERGFIKIEAKTSDNKAIIRVEDSGIGIEKDKQQLIFEEFTQANDGIEKKYGGTGLGLTISKKMVEILGGNLSLESEFGKGSIFEITLPLEFEDAAFKKEKITELPKPNNLTAIVVDDDVNLLNLTVEVLKQHHYNVLHFTDAREALKTIKTKKFDFIVTDIQMPEMDGFTFLEALKNHEDYQQQPVIAVTGRTDFGEHIYKNAGFTTALRKPYSPKILLNVIHSVFNDTEILIDEDVPENGHEKEYSLTSLKAFLPNEEEALKDVLISFIASTKENLDQLEQSFSEDDLPKFKETSHRMYPMFKQIKAEEIASILQDFDLKTLSEDEIRFNLEVLNLKIESLFHLIQQENNLV